MSSPSAPTAQPAPSDRAPRPQRTTQTGRSGEVWRLLGMLAVFLSAGAAITWLVLPPPPPEVTKPPPPQMEVARQPLPLEGDVVADALDLVRRYATAELQLVLPDGQKRSLQPAALGAEIDRARLAEFVRAALEPESALARAHRQQLAQDAGAVLRVPIPIRIDTDKALAELVTMKDGIDRPATDAVVDLTTHQLRPDEVGLRLDVYGTLARVEAALRRGDGALDAAVEVIEPRVKAAALGNVKFDQVLGYFETRYSRSARSKARTYNLRLAASRLDGTVMLPGEEFDFNKTVGPRDEAHGYRVAPVIAEGELVDGIGGGTCQISGTLHGAGFFAGLDIIERYPHSRPSYYIKLGMDATVVYPTINFRMRNPFDVPVVLHETVRNGVVRAEIRGPKRTHTISFFRRLDEVIPFEEVERETDKLPAGKRRLAQRGVPGFKTTVYRIVRAGAHATRTKRRDIYPPTTQIVEIGTGPKDRKTRSDDSHPEYVADQYLIVVQGPKIRSPGVKGAEAGGGTVESRTPGLCGQRGWQQRVGLKVYEPDDEDEDEDEDESDGA